MASAWKDPESQYWTTCFGDENGRRRRISTRETDRKKAQRLADEYEKASRTKRSLREAQAVLDRLHEELSVEPLSFHSLRRTATTLLHEAGVPAAVAQTLIGHDSKAMHELYVSVGREAPEKAAAALPEI